ncbi:unnamed protein product [Durusdinium trenchii]|uniref:Uncharacterized protein n=1 Tax=Durusdinium trenchii TaxID=1381693 RepID=A0ABP0KHB2_9DINO
MAPSSGEAQGFKLEFADLLPPLSTKNFLEEYWGRKPFSTSLSEDMLTIISVGFYDGNLAECVLWPVMRTIPASPSLTWIIFNQTSIKGGASSYHFASRQVPWI